MIWSSTYLAIRVVVAELPPLLSGGARYLVAGLAMLLIARARGHVVPPPAAWGRAFVVGTLLFVVGNGFVSVAATSLGSGVIAVVCGMMPLCLRIKARFFRRNDLRHVVCQVNVPRGSCFFKWLRRQSKTRNHCNIWLI